MRSVVLQMPDNDEMQQFKKCVRKFSRVKMRTASYYHQQLHS